jgi:hypothetical protein
LDNITRQDFLKHFASPFFVAIDDTKIQPRDSMIVQVGNEPAEGVLEELNEQNYGIFFSINKFEKDRKIEHCLGINAWAIDMDAKDIEIETQKLRIKNCPVRPSAVIQSKNGFHCYWFAKDGTIGEYGTILAGLVDYFDGDRNAKDVARVLRVPDFYHCKNPDDKFLVKCVYLKDVSYTEQEMIDAYPTHEELGGISNKEFWKLAGNLNNKEVLTKLSGCKEIRNEIVTFQPNSNGTEQIYINGESTSCWIDLEGKIGSLSGGAPTYVQWLQWYGLNKGQIASMLQEYKILTLPKREKLFINYGDLLDSSESARTKINYAEAIQYPYKILQDTAGGILPDELVVIGADTGVGKSELAFAIEKVNAINGKNVYGIHLEGRPGEITLRDIYQEIRRMCETDVTYIEFMMNIKNLKRESKQAIINIKKRLSDKLKIFNRSGQISIHEFVKIVDRIQHDADLIVVDHLHYFDFQGSNERGEINTIMQVMKDITENRKIPTVLVSHFNRDKNPKKIPNENDLMGSSNIGKQADTVILIYPNFKVAPNYSEGLYPTFFGIPKSRIGLPKKLAYSVMYDGIKKDYRDDYEVWQVNQADGELAALDPYDYPYFLKGKI